MGAKKPVDKSVTEEQLEKKTKSSKTGIAGTGKTSQDKANKAKKTETAKKKAASKKKPASEKPAAAKKDQKEDQKPAAKTAKKAKPAKPKTPDTPEHEAEAKELTSKEKPVKKKAGPKKAKAKEEAAEVEGGLAKETTGDKTTAQAAEKTESEGEGENADEQAAPKKAPAKPKKPKKTRSKKYQAVRSKLDKTRSYDPTTAVELVKRLSYTKFAGTISAHLTVREVGFSKEVALPHATGQARRVEIASDSTLTKIEQGQIDFDVLLATPQFMSKLTKFAPVLGPKGLMPNPKNGTLTPNPEKRQKELQAGSIVLKTERKAPLVHVAIGKTDMETSELVENLQVLFKAFKGKLKKVTIAATMSPGVKVEWEE